MNDTMSFVQYKDIIHCHSGTPVYRDVNTDHLVQLLLIVLIVRVEKYADCTRLVNV